MNYYNSKGLPTLNRQAGGDSLPKPFAGNPNQTRNYGGWGTRVPFPNGTGPTKESGAGNGNGNNNPTPFAGGAQNDATGNNGGVYVHNPVGNPASYAYFAQRFPSTKDLGYMNTGTPFYKQNFGQYTPTDVESQKLYNAMPDQYKLTLGSWARAGLGSFADAYLQAVKLGPSGLIYNNKFMSGDEAAAMIQQQAQSYLDNRDNYARQNKPQPQPTPFRVGG